MSCTREGNWSVEYGIDIPDLKLCTFTFTCNVLSYCDACSYTLKNACRFSGSVHPDLA